MIRDPIHVNATVHTPSSENRLASNPCGRHCWKMVRIMGRICEFTIAPATGRRKISHFLRIPKHAHSGHAGVAAFERSIANRSRPGVSREMIGMNTRSEIAPVIAVSRMITARSVAPALSSLCTNVV